MRPKGRQGSEITYERVKIDDFINGAIEKVEYEEKHEFKGQYGGIFEAVRFKFRLDGYKHLHASRWLKFSYADKATLFQKYLSALVEDAKPHMDFDVEMLEGLNVRTIWKEEKDKQGRIWQDVQLIKPSGAKIKVMRLDEPDKPEWANKDIDVDFDKLPDGPTFEEDAGEHLPF